MMAVFGWVDYVWTGEQKGWMGREVSGRLVRRI